MDNNKFYFDNVPRHIMSADPESVPAKLWGINAKQLDEIDLVFYQLSLINIIELQEGINLDNIGAKIGLSRQGRNDEVYKLLLQIATVDEETDPDHVVSTILALLRGENPIIEPDFPAGAIIKLDNVNPIIPITEVATVINLIWKFARKYTITIMQGADGFAFDTVVGKGFDDLNSPGSGGIFSDIIFSP